MGYAAIGVPKYRDWVPAPGGFGVSPPTFVARYITIGKAVLGYVTTTVNGTSTTTAFTLTMPFTAANTTSQNVTITNLTNNGAAQTTQGRLVFTANSNVATLFINATTGAWTASNTKGASFSFMYERL